MESRLYADTPEYSTAGWYAGRERAPHLEQAGHGWRLATARRLIERAVTDHDVWTVSDLGAGDGGLLSTLRDLPVEAWGYDLQPSNIEGAIERGVDVRLVDFLCGPVEYGDLAVCTETLEHLVDPHTFLRDLPSRLVVASSPVNETLTDHYAFHLWAWDFDGYTRLIQGAGYHVEGHVTDSQFQVILGRRP